MYIFYNVLSNILSKRVNRILSGVELSQIEEIRLTSFSPIIFTVSGKRVYSDARAEPEDIEFTLLAVSRSSIYAINDMMTRGYISYEGGIRVGIAGEYVYSGGSVKTVKNVSSLIIRVPHSVHGAADKLIERIRLSRGIRNTLIIGPPLSGKTTVLREIARVLSKKMHLKVVIIDEKNEISATREGVCGLDVGHSSVLVGALRWDGVESAIRNLSPEVIVTDEIYGERDKACIERCLASGVGVVTSMHGKGIEDSEIGRLFDYVALLSCDPIGAVVQEVSYD